MNSTRSKLNPLNTTRPFSHFEEGSETKEIAQMRFSHYDKRRRNKLAIVVNTLQQVPRRNIFTSPRVESSAKQGNAVFYQQRAYSVSQQSRSLGNALIQTAAEREQQAMQRLVRIKDNIEEQAKRDVEKLHKIFTKNAKRDKHYKETREFALEDAKARHEKLDMKRQMARDFKVREMRENESKGVKEYN